MNYALLDSMSPTDFEHLVYDLLSASGIRNLTWRTPGPDVGRDLEGDHIQIDFSGASTSYRWFIDCKHYGTSVAWPIVWEKISYADSLGADFFLLATQSRPSPQCIDQIAEWNSNHKRPLVRVWARHHVERRLAQVPAVAAKYGLVSGSAVSPFSGLSEQIARLAIATGDATHFDVKKCKVYLDATVSASQLLMVRTGDIERHGRIVVRKGNARSIEYTWLTVEPNDGLSAFDGPQLRALMPALALSYGTSEARLRVDGESLVFLPNDDGRKTTRNPMSPLVREIAFWGPAELHVEPEFVRIAPGIRGVL